jgi:hypothetical protein
MIQGYRLAGKGFLPKAQGHVSQPLQLKQSKKFRLMERGPSCIGYFAADVGYGSLAAATSISHCVRFTPESGHEGG